MNIIFTGALFGVLQVLILSAVIFLLNRNKTFFAILLIAFKVFLYVRGIESLFAKEIPVIMRCATGFLAGLPITGVVIVLIAYILSKRKT